MGRPHDGGKPGFFCGVVPGQSVMKAGSQRELKASEAIWGVSDRELLRSQELELTREI